MSSKNRVDFHDLYMAVLQNGTLFEMSGATQHVPEGAEATTPTDDWVAAEPIHFKGQALLEGKIATMKGALGDTPVADVFLTSTAPLSVEPGRVKGIYATDEEHIYAIAEAMQVEYEAIAASSPPDGHSPDGSRDDVCLADRAHLGTVLRSPSPRSGKDWRHGQPEGIGTSARCWNATGNAGATVGAVTRGRN